MNPCPCGSGIAYTKCCHRFIVAGQLPQSAEELMRSRYTAFTIQNIDYLEKTSSSVALERFCYRETASFAKYAKWRGLCILVTTKTQDPDICLVEFVADYSIHGRASKIHETSRFERKLGRCIMLKGSIWNELKSMPFIDLTSSQFTKRLPLIFHASSFPRKNCNLPRLSNSPIKSTIHRSEQIQSIDFHHIASKIT
jgi:SEC-C motif-containing protein